jgi:hypothetical protein
MISLVWAGTWSGAAGRQGLWPLVSVNALPPMDGPVEPSRFFSLLKQGARPLKGVEK